MKNPIPSKFTPTAFIKPVIVLPDIKQHNLNSIFMALDDACSKLELTENEMTFACEAIRQLAVKEKILP